MIGPLLATSLVSIAGGPTESWGPLRNAGQWTIGAALGLGALAIGAVLYERQSQPDKKKRGGKKAGKR